jgi:hypothetical protein
VPPGTPSKRSRHPVLLCRRLSGNTVEGLMAVGGDPEQPPAKRDAAAGEDDGRRWSSFSTDRF